MNTKLILIIIIVGGLLFGVAFKSVTHNHFRTDARKMAALTFDGSNLVTPATLGQLKGENLFVSIDNPGNPSHGNEITIPADKLLDKVNLKVLNKHKGNIILVSEDQSKVARTWMLLAQTGIKNLYILQ